jgi:hypothetical protein
MVVMLLSALHHEGENVCSIRLFVTPRKRSRYGAEPRITLIIYSLHQ